MPVARGLAARLADLRVKTEVGHELPGARETGGIPDRREHRRRGPDVHPRDRQQPLEPGPLKSLLGDPLVKLRDLGALEVDLAQAALDRLLLLLGELLLEQPRPRPTALSLNSRAIITAPQLASSTT